jgi:hypothetical protein
VDEEAADGEADLSLVEEGSTGSRTVEALQKIVPAIRQRFGSK